MSNTMNALDAISLLGINATRGPIRSMVAALSLHPWHNTSEDNGRLEAGRYVLAHWADYQAACNARRAKVAVAVVAPAVDGKPAWHGRYRDAQGKWRTVRSGYGAIAYMTPGHAEEAARYTRDLEAKGTGLSR